MGPRNSRQQPIVPLDARLTLIEGVPAFAALPLSARTAMATLFEEETFANGGQILAEGDQGDKMYIIAEGLVEVSTTGPKGVELLATLGVGQIFGEIALLTPGSKRTASVKALADTTLLSLDQAAFQRVSELFPEVWKAFSATAEVLLTAKFLKTSSPLSALDADTLRSLAQKSIKVPVPADTMILNQGEKGDRAYVLLQGQVEVFTEHEGKREHLTYLKEGGLFGVTSLVADQPRMCSVRTLEPCELIELQIEDIQ